MGNSLSHDEVGRLLRAFSEGMSLRAVARELGISTNTARRYKPAELAPCSCGQPAGHKGWCKNRYATSAARQAYHAKRRGEQVTWTPPPRPTSRVTHASAEKRRWLGVGDEWLSEVRPIAQSEHYGAIGEVRHCTRKIRLEWRDDVSSSMLVSVLDGRLPRCDIARAVPTFIGHEMRSSVGAAFGLRSLDEPFTPDTDATIGQVYGAAEWWQSAYA